MPKWTRVTGQVQSPTQVTWRAPGADPVVRSGLRRGQLRDHGGSANFPNVSEWARRVSPSHAATYRPTPYVLPKSAWKCPPRMHLLAKSCLPTCGLFCGLCAAWQKKRRACDAAQGDTASQALLFSQVGAPTAHVGSTGSRRFERAPLPGKTCSVGAAKARRRQRQTQATPAGARSL